MAINECGTGVFLTSEELTAANLVSVDGSLARIAAIYGSRPTITGAGVKTFTANAHGFRAIEATTISIFKNAAGAAVVIGWESKVITAGETIWFGTLIKSITVTVGGLGQYYLAESDL